MEVEEKLDLSRKREIDTSFVGTGVQSIIEP